MELKIQNKKIDKLEIDKNNILKEIKIINNIIKENKNKNINDEILSENKVNLKQEQILILKNDLNQLSENFKTKMIKLEEHEENINFLIIENSNLNNLLTVKKDFFENKNNYPENTNDILNLKENIEIIEKIKLMNNNEKLLSKDTLENNNKNSIEKILIKDEEIKKENKDYYDELAIIELDKLLAITNEDYYLSESQITKLNIKLFGDIEQIFIKKQLVDYGLN